MKADRAATTKAQILQELEQLPESVLVKVLAFARSLEAEPDGASPDLIPPDLTPPDLTPPDIDPEVWQAYLASKRERQEVYRRLADS